MRFPRSLFVMLPCFVVACGSDDSSDGTASQTPDAGFDASMPDSSVSDATPDTGQPDTGQPDTGQPDTSTPETGTDTGVDTGSDTSPPQDAGPDATGSEQALATYADAICNLFDTCAPFMLGYLYGDLQNCIDRYVAGGRAAVLPDAPGVGRSAGDVIACADALSTMTCEELYAGGRDTACPSIAGTLSDGEGCFSDLQCATGFCDRSGDCGTCAPRLALGDGCEVANVGCDDDQTCTAPTMADPTTCTATAGEGESCSAAVVCRGNLYCHEGSCEQPGGDGDSCDGGDGSCNGLLGLECSGGTCQTALTLADVGEACGIVGSSYVPCRGTAYCDDATSKCVAKLDDGAGCVAGATNQCKYYASCRNDVCTVDTEPTCP